MTVSRTRRHRRIGALAVVSIVILTVGWTIRPQNTPTPPPPPPSELDLPRLGQAAERRSIENTTAYFGALATRFSAVLVRARDGRAAGILWKPSLVVTPRADGAPPPFAATAVEAGAPRDDTTLAGPQLPLTAVEAPVSDATGAVRGTKPKRPGDGVLAVWLTDTDPAFAPGLYHQQTSATCRDAAVEEVVSSVAVSNVMLGGALFDTNGQVLALILPCGERAMAVAASSVDGMLNAAATPEGRLVGRHGLVVGPVTEAEAAFFKWRDGAIVREVWAGYSAARAGVIPGDIIQAIDGTAVTESADVASVAVTSNIGAAMLSVRRGAKLLSLTLLPPTLDALVPAGDTQLGLIWQAGYRIDGVVAGSPAARAGARPGDRLVRINQREPVGTSQVQRLLNGTDGNPVFVEFARRDRHWGALVR